MFMLGLTRLQRAQKKTVIKGLQDYQSGDGGNRRAAQRVQKALQSLMGDLSAIIQRTKDMPSLKHGWRGILPINGKKEELNMGRNSNSLQHELIKQVLPDIENNKTSTAYKRHIKNFAKWAKSNGYKKPENITEEVIQEYENYLENVPKNYSPSTIHTYLAPVCLAVGVSMDKIRKPRRSARSITRGRELDTYGQPITQNLQGRRQEKNPRYERLVVLQAALGIRRNELRHLVGADLINRGESWYVRVRRGKGG